MSNHEMTPHELLEKWLDGEQLTDAQQAQVLADPETKPLFESAQSWQSMASSYEEQAAPSYSPIAMPELKQASRFQGHWMQWGMAACVGFLSLLSVQLWQQNQTLEQGLVAQQTQIATQQDTMQQILAQMQKSQNLQADLTNQVLLTNRAERQVALDDLLAFLQTQRAQDQAILRLQLNELAEQVEHAPLQTLAHNGGQ
ncbi:hypothetical protein [Pseudoalteromonas phenolica]|uniref:hypothetical protein n=1 Tax=Pseudoalteromonas phenolica TaxID=161398 RepID=UPI00110AC77D|nr:hypothetical protein [Pseudoalteromonas phenolica]